MSQTPILSIAVVFASLSAPTPSKGQGTLPLPQAYQIERAHSYVGFSIRFMGLTYVRGSFANVFGTIVTDGAVERSFVTAMIRANSMTLCCSPASGSAHRRQTPLMALEGDAYYLSGVVRRVGFMAATGLLAACASARNYTQADGPFPGMPLPVCIPDVAALCKVSVAPH